MTASRDSDFAALEQLLQRPRNRNDSKTDGKTALFHAAGQGHLQLVELLFPVPL